MSVPLHVSPIQNLNLVKIACVMCLIFSYLFCIDSLVLNVGGEGRKIVILSSDWDWDWGWEMGMERCPQSQDMTV